jgi:peptidoglycan/LPS O-acetylase OafA/YrhL
MSATDQATDPHIRLPLADLPQVRPRGASRLRALDGLRLLAALMVCMYHFAGKNGEVAQSWHQSPGVMFPTLSRFATYGSLGVQFFFVISGFVICMSSWGRTL